jgi:uncharacterized protein (DUF1499 family)
MLKSALSFLCLIVLMTVCWMGSIFPAVAVPRSLEVSQSAIVQIAQSQIIPIASPPLAMAKKSLFSFSGKRPTNLGVTDGRLAACPTTPNCVSSQAPDSDEQHKIAPLTYAGSPSEAMSALKAVVQGMERTEIISEGENYLYAEFTTPIMGYVDDVEFWLDPSANVIHVRSASRLGQSDLGVNRKRVEEIRAQFTAVAHQ